MPKQIIPEGKVECESCNGTGECVVSCCTGEIINDDFAMCPVCHEHLGEDTCETCDGKGYVDEDFDEYPDKVSGLGARAELLMDIQKGH